MNLEYLVLDDIHSGFGLVDSELVEFLVAPSSGGFLEDGNLVGLGDLEFFVSGKVHPTDNHHVFIGVPVIDFVIVVFLDIGEVREIDEVPNPLDFERSFVVGFYVLLTE